LISSGVKAKDKQRHYRLQCVKPRTAERFTKAADASRSAAIEIFPSQCTTCERLVSDQGNAEFAARVQHAIGFGLPVQQGILDLVGGKRNAAFSQRLVRGPHLRGGVVADTDGLDLPCLDSIRHQPHQRGNVHPRARKMMLVQLDRGAFQVPEANVERVGHVLRPCHRGARELRRDHNLLALRKLSESALRGAIAVHRRRVEEVHLRSKGRLESCLLVGGVSSSVRDLGRHHLLQTARLAPHHHTQAESRHADVAAAQHRCLRHLDPSVWLTE
jgi:hypothetical protein